MLAEVRKSGVRMAVNAVGGIGNIKSRVAVFEILTSAGFDLPPVVHPSAVIEPSASLSPGAQIFAQAYIGGEARIGFGVIVSTGGIVSHDCVLDEYSIISPGAILWPEQGLSDEHKEEILSRTALGRAGSPDDIARALLFLVRDADYITGQIIAVDGGRTLQQ